MNIAIIDYGLGNIRSVYNAFKLLKARPLITDRPGEIKKADKIVLPGVGAIGDAVKGLSERDILEPLIKRLSEGVLYLGICLGLQILFEKSEEGASKGLGVLKGEVRRFNEKDGIKVPQIGWNKVKLNIKDQKSNITAGITDEAYFYFDHSYYAEPADKNIITGTTDYGKTYASMIQKNNIYAVQFHPERSQSLGLRLLENFIKL